MTHEDRAQLEAEFRQQLQEVVVLVRPYANPAAVGHFNDLADIGVMLALLETTVQRAKAIHQRLKRP